MRGDEPVTLPPPLMVTIVFPTCVGMNRIPEGRRTNAGSVPHMRGDEPPDGWLIHNHIWCSPHAWG